MKIGILLKMIFLSVLTSLMVLVAFAGNESMPSLTTTPDLYWLSFMEYGKGTYVMQIDSTGNVIRAPVFMGEFGPAISHNGATKINLWGLEQRIVINKKNLSTAKKIKNAIGYLNSITNKKERNFVTIVGEEPLSLKFFGVSPTGATNGAGWNISLSRHISQCDYVPCPPGALSSDGKAILWMTRAFIFSSPGIYIQPLTDTGRPNGPEILVSSGVDALSGAISDILPGGKIYLVYQQPRQLILQAIDAQTGQKIGDKIILRNAQLGRSRIAISIDPLGRFVIYAYKNQQRVYFLYFLPLDATGHPSGSSKVLLRKVYASEIRLLKD